MNERELFELKLAVMVDCRAGVSEACEAEKLLERLERLLARLLLSK
ncbi:MAG: hypothetical protein F7C38_06840 [Desulfurococcales archaeon]|nr:hypothetical protein [Desulfurococcales archaeon]